MALYHRNLRGPPQEIAGLMIRDYANPLVSLHKAGYFLGKKTWGLDPYIAMAYTWGVIPVHSQPPVQRAAAWSSWPCVQQLCISARRASLASLRAGETFWRFGRFVVDKKWRFGFQKWGRLVYLYLPGEPTKTFIFRGRRKARGGFCFWLL